MMPISDLRDRFGVDRKNLSLGIEASLVMPISDPRERFFYPHHTPMIDTYCLAEYYIRRKNVPSNQQILGSQDGYDYTVDSRKNLNHALLSYWYKDILK